MSFLRNSYFTRQHDVSNLMAGRWSTKKDENKVKEAPKLPLTLSRVMEGHPITSQSLFLALPSEILSKIMDLVAKDKAALSALALVNSDCRQLARSYQFVDVCFDYGTKSRNFLARLLDEAQIREEADSETTTPLFIGSCIRRVKVQPSPRNVAKFHKSLWESGWGPDCLWPQGQKDEILNKAHYDYLTKYRFPILQALTEAMPHLDSLIWDDEMCLDTDVFKTLSRLPLQQLKFSGAYVGMPLSLEAPIVPQIIPMKSLSLGISPCRDELHSIGRRANSSSNSSSEEDLSISTFILSYLKHCSESLESLTINAGNSKVEQFLGHEAITFPRLQYLDLSEGTSYPDQAVWSAFLAAPLRHLSLPLNGIKTSAQYLTDCPKLRNLETLIVPSLSMKAELAKLVVDFVLHHSHVRKLSIRNGAPRILNEQILPALTDGNWSNLTSLAISWPDPKNKRSSDRVDGSIAITAESLATINKIQSLKQLCIGFGGTTGWVSQWRPDHDDLPLQLQGLVNLQKLAFMGDTYKIPPTIQFRDKENYYDDRWVTHAEYKDATTRPHLDPGRHLRPKYALGDPGPDYVYDSRMGYRFEEDGDGNGTGGGSADLVPNDVVWERAHRNRMLCHAEKYAAVLPKLSWVFLGQLRMLIKATEGSEKNKLEATPLSKERDPVGEILVPIFEMKGDA